MKRSAYIILMFIVPILVWGQENETITKKLKAKYDFACYHSTDGGWYSIKQNGKEGACDLNGKEIIPPIWDDVYFHGTYYKVKKNDFVGIRDLSDRELIAADQYEDILYYQMAENNACEVKKNGRIGALSKNLTLIIPCKYDQTSIFQLREGQICQVKLNGKNGVYDVAKQKEIVPCMYDGIYSSQLREGQVCTVETFGKKGVYDIEKQKEIIPCKYDEIRSFELKEYGFCRVEVDKKCGLVNKNGEVIISCKYDDMKETSLKNGYCIVINNNKYGVIDKNGKEIISPNKYGYIELGYKNNQIITAFVQSGALIKPSYFDENYKYYQPEYIRKGKCGVVDLSGKEIISCKYDDICISDDGLYTFNVGGSKPKIIEYGKTTATGGRWGVIDANNKIVIPAEYDTPIVFEDGVAQVSKSGISSLLPHPYKGSSLAFANGTTSNDVDNNIPETKRKANETFAFIIANENYTHFSGADYSINDGKIFTEYCKKTLGLPEHNVRYFEDATYGNLVSTIKKVEDIANVYEGDATIIFYYSGLGTVDEQSKERYILPTDASDVSIKNTGYQVQKLIEQLNSLNTKGTIVMLDAPFSGTDKKGDLLIKNRGVRISPKQNTAKGNTLICLSNNSNENSYASKKYGHGLFTYAVLKKMKEAKGDFSWKELLVNASDMVKKVSLSEFDNVQTPLIITSGK